MTRPFWLVGVCVLLAGCSKPKPLPEIHYEGHILSNGNLGIYLVPDGAGDQHSEVTGFDTEDSESTGHTFSIEEGCVLDGKPAIRVEIYWPNGDSESLCTQQDVVVLHLGPKVRK